MGRVVKDPELRRNEIMTVAQALFYKNGYNNTSVNKIIEALGISKGAFYHYFKSKEDLLDQLAENFTKDILDSMQTILNDKNMNAIQKLNQIYLKGSIYKAERFDFILTLVNAIYNDDNLFLRYKFNQKSLDYSLPMMSEILKQGKEEGLFRIENPEITARHVLLFGTSIASHNAELLMKLEEVPENINKVMQHFREYQRSVERILGAPKNSIKAFDKAFLETLNKHYKDKL